MRRELELLKKGQRPEGSPVPPAEIREFFRLPHVWTSIKIPFQGTCAERLASWIKALEKVDAGKIKPLVQSWTRSGVPEMN
jgi:hypothetical protein